MNAVWAVLAAAGTGERLGGDRPKAFANLGGAGKDFSAIIKLLDGSYRPQ